jgi:hypothetical protein
MFKTLSPHSTYAHTSFFFFSDLAAISFSWVSNRFLLSLSACPKKISSVILNVHFSPDEIKTRVDISLSICLILLHQDWSNQLIHGVIRGQLCKFLGPTHVVRSESRQESLLSLSMCALFSPSRSQTTVHPNAVVLQLHSEGQFGAFGIPLPLFEPAMTFLEMVGAKLDLT